MGVSSLAAYNGSGTQGTAVTNTITTSDDGDVQSVFWNANDTTRVLLFGSSINEIPSTGGMGATWGGNQVFTVNNDLDALGDLYLTVGMSMESSNAPTTNAAAEADAYLYQNGLIYFIKRVEFMVGTQVWQTLETADILAANVTEKTEGEYHSIQLNAMGNSRSDGNQLYSPDSLHQGPVYADGKRSNVTFKLPVLTKTLASTFEKFANNTEDGYLMAAAPHQQVKVKVYFADNGKNIFSPMVPQVNDIDETDRKYGDWAVSLLGKHQIMCNAERQQLKNMPQGLPKRIKMTQNALFTASSGFTSGKTITVDLDHFSLYASYLVIRIDYGLNFTPSTDAAPTLFDPSSGMPSTYLLQNRIGIPGIKSAELLLNSTSVSGILPGTLLSNSAADSLGIFSNSASVGSSNLRDYYIFPLASHAYDGSAIPLNRFDNIRLKVVPDNTTTVSGKISVTCFGETTALYRGGAASLAMY